MNTAIEASAQDAERMRELAREARAQGRSADASAILAEARQRFSDHPGVYVDELRLLWESGALPAAEALAQDAGERFPTDPWVHIERAWVAHTRGDWSEAAARWARVRELRPEEWVAYGAGVAALMYAKALDEAEQVFQLACARFQPLPDANARRDGARLAVLRGDHEEALRRWEALRRDLSDDPEAFVDTALAAFGAGAREHAQGLLMESFERFPDYVSTAADRLREAHRQLGARDHLAACESLIELLPNDARGYLGAAAALDRLDRAADARVVLLDAQSRLPDNADIALECQLRSLSSDPAERMAALEALHARHPTHAPIAAEYAGALLANGRLPDTAALLGAINDRPEIAGTVHRSLADAALASGDWLVAETHWKALTELDPTDAWAWQQLIKAVDRQDRERAQLVAASACRVVPDNPSVHATAIWLAAEGRHYERAQAIAATAEERFPDNAEVLVQCAWAAHGAEDWASSCRRWAQVRRLLPDDRFPCVAGAAALMYQGELEEAEALYQYVISRWGPVSADDAGRDHATLAYRRRDFEAAAERWRAFRLAHPDLLAGYQEEGRARIAAGQPDAAHLLLDEARERFESVGEMALALAQEADLQPDLSDRLANWETVVKLYPEDPRGYLRIADILDGMGRYRDAEVILQPLTSRFRDVPEIAESYAHLATRMDQREEAMRRWQTLLKRFPDRPRAYDGAARILAAEGKLADAATMLKTAHTRFPWDTDIELAWILAAGRTDAADITVARLHAMSTRLPANSRVATELALALIDIDQPLAAQRVLEKLRAGGETGYGIESALAQCATRTKDWAAAITHWRAAVDLQPQSYPAWSGLSDAHRGAGETAASAASLREALQHLPGHIELLEKLAWAESFAENWERALPLWLDLKLRFPGRQKLIQGMKEVLYMAEQAKAATPEKFTPELDATLQALLSNDDANERNLSLQRLVLRFESLGDSCELGLVQRRLGVEPIGLLRWSTIYPKELISALKSDFLGVGDEEFTAVRSVNGEFTSHDLRYGMYTHTFVPDTTSSVEEFRATFLPRLRYMRRKLLEDLQGGRKIFVYKSERSVSDSDLSSLLAGVRKHNMGNRLLFVRKADAIHPPGSLVVVSKQLYVGHLARFSEVDYDFEGWIALLEKCIFQIEQP